METYYELDTEHSCDEFDVVIRRCCKMESAYQVSVYKAFGAWRVDVISNDNKELVNTSYFWTKSEAERKASSYENIMVEEVVEEETIKHPKGWWKWETTAWVLDPDLRGE